MTKIITDNDQIEEVDTKITLTKSSSASIFRMKDTPGENDQDDAQENSAKNSAGESSENNNNSEDKHNKSDDNLFESVSKELTNNNNSSNNNNKNADNNDSENNNNENSANSLDDFDVKPPNPKKRDLPSESSSSVDSDKENSPVVVEPK